MVDRIFIGKENNTQLIRISKPGFDVKDKANPMIFSSENDYMKIHYRNTVQLNKRNQSGRTYWYGKTHFPALTFYPMVWYTYRWTVANDQTVRFPTQDSANIFWDYGCCVNKNSLWFSFANWSDYGGATAHVDFIVFNNRME